jgi:hypothetical protein
MKYKAFKGELHKSKAYVTNLYAPETLKRLKREWMDAEDTFPNNWIQRAIKALAEEEVHKDFRLT